MRNEQLTIVLLNYYDDNTDNLDPCMHIR